MARVLNPAALIAMCDLVGISRRELGRRAGLHPGSVSNIVNGKHPVTPETQRKLADVLGVKLDAITIPVPEPEEVAS
jgi:transcriptional regulator with XRE-family HTH domain